MSDKPAKPKAGKVIRVSDMAWAYLCKVMGKETIRETVDKVVKQSEKARVYYILPDMGAVFDTIAEARGAAIMYAVKTGQASPSTPIEVFEVA